jgi:hypothetical protein
MDSVADADEVAFAEGVQGGRRYAVHDCAVYIAATPILVAASAWMCL